MSFDFPFVVIQLLNGLTNAMFIFLLASGLSIIFGVLGVLNFAHGSFYMLGAYMAYQGVSFFVDSGFPNPIIASPQQNTPSTSNVEPHLLLNSITIAQPSQHSH